MDLVSFINFLKPLGCFLTKLKELLCWMECFTSLLFHLPLDFGATLNFNASWNILTTEKVSTSYAVPYWQAFEGLKSNFMKKNFL